MHRTLHFDLRDNAIGNYTLGLALTNKKRLKTMVEHQLIDVLEFHSKNIGSL